MDEYKFKCEFPHVDNYDDINEVMQHLPHLLHCNANRTITTIKALLTHHRHYYALCMGSTNDDDIHKAIKY